MSGGLVLEVDTLDALSPVLRRLRAAASDLTEPMAKASDVMLEATHERFDEGRGPLGIPWQKSQAAIEEGRKTLIKSGDLRRSIDSTSGKDYAAVAVDRIGDVTDYAHVHQWGATIRPRKKKALRTPYGPRGSVTIPARPYLGFSDDEIMAIDRILVRHLLSAMNGGAAA